MHLSVVALHNTMSDLLNDMKRFSHPIQMLIRARINEEKRNQTIRYNNGLSRHSTIANGIGKSCLPLSCERNGTRKPSPLRNSTNAADLVRRDLQPSLQQLRPLVVLLIIPPPTSQSTGSSGKRLRMT